MNYFIGLFVVLIICHTSCASYSPYEYGPQQQQLVQQQEIIQQQLQLLQQQQQLLQRLQQQQQQGQGQKERETNLNIVLPKALIEDFEYLPTVQGYRYNYELQDGTKREENAYITGLRMDDYSRLDSKNTDLTAVGAGGRPKMKLKNRKLSPGSLKSLSG